MDVNFFIAILAHESMDLVQQFLDTTNSSIATANLNMLRRRFRGVKSSLGDKINQLGVNFIIAHNAASRTSTHVHQSCIRQGVASIT